jgi:hypothetical protein
MSLSPGGIPFAGTSRRRGGGPTTCSYIARPRGPRTAADAIVHVGSGGFQGERGCDYDAFPRHPWEIIRAVS